MKGYLYIIFFALTTSLNAQYCPVEDKWHCGNDLRLNGNNINYRPMHTAKPNMCDRCMFDRVSQLSQWPDPYPSDWQTIFTDDFNANSLDRNYWNLMFPWGNNVTTDDYKDNLCNPTLNYLENGKLVQKGESNVGSFPLTSADGSFIDLQGNFVPNPVLKPIKTFIPFASTIFKIPINCRIRGNIKIIGDCEKNWPAFWIRGHYLEIDIFEFTNSGGNSYDNTFPNNYPKMSYGNTRYGAPFTIVGYNGSTPITNEQAFNAQYGSDNGTDFSLGFHTYELIWDQFKIQFWIDGQIIYDDFVFFKIKNSWSNYHEKRHWRESPVKKPSDLDPTKPHYVNKYALDNLAYAMHLILGFGAPVEGSDYSVNQMETDWVSFGLRSNCSSGDNLVSSLHWFDYNQWGGTAYETGYKINTDPNAVISVGNFKTAFFAATDEIAFNPGVEFFTGSVVCAQLTACESGWDARTTSGVDFTEPSEEDSTLTADSSQSRLANQSNELSISETDSIIYFNKFNEFDELFSFTELKNYEDHLTLTAIEEPIKSVEIYAMNGQLIFHNSTINSNFISIQKQIGWRTGLYIIRVYGTKNMHIHRIWMRGN